MCASVLIFFLHIFFQDIQFPISNLDLYDLCSPDLQHKLMPARKRFKEVEDAKMVCL